MQIALTARGRERVWAREMKTLLSLAAADGAGEGGEAEGREATTFVCCLRIL